MVQSSNQNFQHYFAAVYLLIRLSIFFRQHDVKCFKTNGISKFLPHHYEIKHTLSEMTAIPI